MKVRRNWMPLCQRGPGDWVPHAYTLWDFREALISAMGQARAEAGIIFANIAFNMKRRCWPEGQGARAWVLRTIPAPSVI